MNFTNKSNSIRWLLVGFSFLIISLILWNTYTLMQIFRKEERHKMELWATAQKTLQNATDETEVDLPLQILTNNETIPTILLDGKDSILSFTNFDESLLKNPKKKKNLILQFKQANNKINIEYDKGKRRYLYYMDSALLSQLKYYPMALITIILLFGALVYNYYRTNKISTQNKLWAGMAKETAHQIGTPLSSLMGWIEIMKADQIDENIVSEIEKDLLRLQNITERFSKIGSEPKLENRNIVEETKLVYDYLASRFEGQVKFQFFSTETVSFAKINPTLHSWTIENLVKNAIDAMRGRGDIDIIIEEQEEYIKIKIADTGKGIPRSQFKKIFEPGFTTKKRGWGLGLSLTKRIVEEYHKGKIRVLHSEINKGTTFQISYKKCI
ncbi:HAMP domain-containing sensor histidine kinase [Flavobacterium columnare]|uniref:histidine kinase n=2 Tax=Flavobacterium TaxID=237 RepID=A0A2N9P6X8_9FLAO|nr:HAMP domain-containing sensor histidine kinase [Flavobacterium columnare]RVU91024.1 HAMP domain-containing histidine kinase [Flavobacterium columnare]SPE76085.1 Sporulation kinase A [Flavobacterium columnare]